MKNVGLIGRNGFIGKTVFEILKKNFLVVDEPAACDVLVNCAGFSRMYAAHKNPQLMKRVEDYTFWRMQRIPFNRLIHLSTIYIDASPTHAYSVLKKRMERNILDIWPNSTIFRLASVLGPGLQKNVIFDLAHRIPLWVTPDSIYNYISSEELGNIITYFVDNHVPGTFNVGASKSISVSDVVKITSGKAKYGNKKDEVLMNVSFLQKHYKVKTSEEYVKEYWEKYCG